MSFFSVVIITFNEAHNIRACLESVHNLTDDIIVMDSFSTDNTQIICEEFGVRFYQQKFKGYGLQKNDANALAKYEYILSLDADERLSKELIQSISNLKINNLAEAYSFNRLTNYCGQWIKHTGWYPDVKIRLWAKSKAIWSEDLVHEQLIISSVYPIQHLTGDILHFSFRTEAEHLAQIDKFTSLKAQALYEKGRKGNPLFKYIKPAFRFFQMYILKLGFLDGRAGFKISKYSARAKKVVYQKLDKMYQSQKNIE